MNLTLTKKLRLLAIALVMCLVLPLASCNSGIKDIDESDQVCVSGALYESWMYVITDAEFIDEMATIFGGIKYEKSDKAVNMMDADKVLNMSFSKGNDVITKIIVDENGIFAFEAGGQSYKITSNFDYYHIRSLVDAEIEAVKTRLDATDDEV